MFMLKQIALAACIIGSTICSAMETKEDRRTLQQLDQQYKDGVAYNKRSRNSTPYEPNKRQRVEQKEQGALSMQQLLTQKREQQQADDYQAKLYFEWELPSTNKDRLNLHCEDPYTQQCVYKDTVTVGYIGSCVLQKSERKKDREVFFSTTVLLDAEYYGEHEPVPTLVDSACTLGCVKNYIALKKLPKEIPFFVVPTEPKGAKPVRNTPTQKLLPNGVVIPYTLNQ